MKTILHCTTANKLVISGENRSFTENTLNTTMFHFHLTAPVFWCSFKLGNHLSANSLDLQSSFYRSDLMYCNERTITWMPFLSHHDTECNVQFTQKDTHCTMHTNSAPWHCIKTAEWIQLIFGIEATIHNILRRYK